MRCLPPWLICCQTVGLRWGGCCTTTRWSSRRRRTEKLPGSCCGPWSWKGSSALLCLLAAAVLVTAAVAGAAGAAAALAAAALCGERARLTHGGRCTQVGGGCRPVQVGGPCLACRPRTLPPAVASAGRRCVACNAAGLGLNRRNHSPLHCHLSIAPISTPPTRAPADLGCITAIPAPLHACGGAASDASPEPLAGLWVSGGGGGPLRKACIPQDAVVLLLGDFMEVRALSTLSALSSEQRPPAAACAVSAVACTRGRGRWLLVLRKVRRGGNVECYSCGATRPSLRQLRASVACCICPPYRLHSTASFICEHACLAATRIRPKHPTPWTGAPCLRPGRS